MRGVLPFLIASVLACISPLTTEVFAPAMRLARGDVGVVRIEESVSLFLAASSVCHLLHGWSIARVGLAPVTLCALVLYTAASIAVATDLPIPFLWTRVVQGVGASGCTVCGMASVRMHLSPRVDVPRIHSVRAMALVVAPMVSELVVKEMWRAYFSLIEAIGIVGLSLALAASSCPRGRPPSSSSTLRGEDDVVLRAMVRLRRVVRGHVRLNVYAPFLTDVLNFGVCTDSPSSAVPSSVDASSFDQARRGGGERRGGAHDDGVHVESEAVFAPMTVSNFARGVNGARAGRRSCARRWGRCRPSTARAGGHVRGGVRLQRIARGGSRCRGVIVLARLGRASSPDPKQWGVGGMHPERPSSGRRATRDRG